MNNSQELARIEREEIERSAQEASSAPLDELLVRDTSRYMDPPPECWYPLEFAYHLLGDVRGKMVLDFGAGQGENTLLLAKKGARVVAMDISHALLQLARQRLRVNGVSSAEANFIVGSAHNIPLREESVDVVFGIAILHHLDLGLAAREIHRVLRKGGRAIFQEPIRNSKVLRMARKLIPFRRADVSAFERPLTDEELVTFAGPFNRGRGRAFLLPGVNLVQRLPIKPKYVGDLYRQNARLLNRFPRLNFYACVKVVEMVK